MTTHDPTSALLLQANSQRYGVGLSRRHNSCSRNTSCHARAGPKRKSSLGDVRTGPGGASDINLADFQVSVHYVFVTSVQNTYPELPASIAIRRNPIPEPSNRFSTILGIDGTSPIRIPGGLHANWRSYSVQAGRSWLTLAWGSSPRW